MASIVRRTGRNGARYQVRYFGPDRRRRSETFSTRREAERFAKTAETDILRGTYVDPRLGLVTFAEWAERWWETTARLKPKTRAGYREILDCRVLPVFGRLPLSRIEPIDVEAWVSKMRSEGLSASRTRNCYYVLSMVLRSAVRSGYLARSAAQVEKRAGGDGLPRLPETDVVVISADELEDLADAIDPRYRSLIFVLGWGGLRFGEAAALQRRDCELLRSRLHVAASLSDVNGTLHFVETKTYATRNVRLPKRVVEALAVHLESVPADAPAVFTSQRGLLLRHQSFMRQAWRPALALAGLPEKLTPHSLRHTCASILVSQGADPVQVQKHLGHEDVATTLRLYRHLFEREQDELGAKLDALADGVRRSEVSQTVPKLSRAVVELPRRSSGNRL